MKTIRCKARPRLLAVLAALLVISFGCGDDDNPVGTDGATYDDPTGNWSVTSTNISVTVTDYGSIPSQVIPYVEGWLRELIAGGGNSQWYTIQVAAVLTSQEAPMCIPLPAAYDEGTRSCTATIPVQVNDLDVSDLGLCQNIQPVGTFCITHISIDATITPTLQWPEGFRTFSGDQTIGSAQVPASVTVTITGPVSPGDYTVLFYASRDLSGSRCSVCNPCP